MSQTSKQGATALTFLVFPLVKFAKVCILHDREAYFWLMQAREKGEGKGGMGQTSQLCHLG